MTTRTTSRNRRTRRTPVVALLALGALLLLTGCSSSSTATSADTTAAPTGPTRVVTALTTSVDKVLHTVGVSGEHVYGFNHLAGDGTSGAGAVKVEMLATVNYTNGSGDFDGVITITYPDASTLGFRMVDGSTVAATDTTDATFHSEIEVIDGSGAYAGATGSGTFDGTRKDALGGAVDMTFEFRLG